MLKYSAGFLPYRITRPHSLEMLIVHPGGPLWAKKDEGVWSIPKGEYEPGEDPLGAAEREFFEEIGERAPTGERLDLGELKQPSGKRVIAWAIRADIDVEQIKSNLFELEWPPRSGMSHSYPEVDRAIWCSVDQARTKLLRGQVPFIDRLIIQLRDHHGLDISVKSGIQDTY